jgi:hypothetical protein
MVEGSGLKVWRLGHLQWHDLSIEFHKNLPIGSKVIRGGDTDRQTGDLISLTFVFKESRLKNETLNFQYEPPNTKLHLSPFRSFRQNMQMNSINFKNFVHKIQSKAILGP